MMAETKTTKEPNKVTAKKAAPRTGLVKMVRDDGKKAMVHEKMVGDYQAAGYVKE